MPALDQSADPKCLPKEPTIPEVERTSCAIPTEDAKGLPAEHVDRWSRSSHVPGTSDASGRFMTTSNQLVTRPSSKLLPKHGPAWTFYAFTALAVAVAIATAVGFKIAAMAHWF